MNYKRWSQMTDEEKAQLKWERAGCPRVIVVNQTFQYPIPRKDARRIVRLARKRG